MCSLLFQFSNTVPRLQASICQYIFSMWRFKCKILNEQDFQSVAWNSNTIHISIIRLFFCSVQFVQSFRLWSYKSKKYSMHTTISSYKTEVIGVYLLWELKHSSFSQILTWWLNSGELRTGFTWKQQKWCMVVYVNHKLLLIFIIKVVYLCTLHNTIISHAHFVVYMLWRPTPTWFSNINAKIRNFSCGWMLTFSLSW